MVAYEEQRLAALKAFEILDTSAEPSFDRIAQLAGDLFDVPIALVSLVDAERQWFKARVGLDACSTPRDISFCTHAIEMGERAVLVVEDALKDERFASNPLVTGAPHIRFYAGATLTTAGGHNLGTLCVIDTKPRSPSERELARLRKLAQIVVDEIELAFAERQARKKQRLLELAENVSGAGYWRVDLGTGSLDWSDAVYEIHGVTRETFDTGVDSAIDFYHPEDRAMVSANIDHAIATKQGFDFQLRLIRADGALRHVVSKAVCELNDSGEVSALVGVFQDITDHIESLKAIESSEAQYRLLAENSTDIIAEFDRRGKISFVSPACRTVLGYTEAEMIGQRMWEYIHPDDAEQVARQFAKLEHAKAGERSVVVRYRARRADGSWIWLEGRPGVKRDPETGAIVSYQDSARDVTADVAAEHELVEARREAEAAAQAKADFLANMSHELRTPLTAMLGFANLVKDQPELADTTRVYIERAVTAGEALRATVNDILDFSALEAGRVEIERSPVRVATCIERLVDLFAPQAAEKGLVLSAELERLPGFLSIDEHRIRQVLLNLVGNAVKFTDDGSIELAASYDTNAARLMISVSDTGVGIAEDAVQRLFQRFSLVDASTTRKYGGTGLGLAICKGIVEAMGGEIGVESSPGAGSKFWFSVPAEIALGDVGVADDEARGLELPSHCRVLVADDNESVRTLLSAVLEALGAQVKLVVDGEAAVEAVMEQPFDMILMDRMMPGIGGENAARKIRETSGPNQDTPIVALTADRSRLDAPELFDGVAGKPLDMQELAQAIAGALGIEQEFADVA